MEEKICQSCGMPLDTAEVCGTNKDGSQSGEYCTYCYQDGAFTEPDATLESMADTCVQHIASDDPNMTEEKLKEMMTSYLSALSRWK